MPIGKLNQGVWGKYLDNLQYVGNEKIKKKPKIIQDDLKALFEQIIDDLKEGDVLQEFDHAIKTAEQNTDNHRIIEYIYREIVIFNKMVANIISNVASPEVPESELEEDVYDATNTGKTIKDSIENIFKLPGWLKKLLNILNGLLSIIIG